MKGRDLAAVEINSQDPRRTLHAILGTDRPNVEAGYGGWTEIARPRRSSLSFWTGSPSLRMTLSVIFDGFAEGESVEGDLLDLETLATPTSRDGSPPRVKVSARGGAVPHQERTWVIDSLDWGDAIMGPTGDRLRQEVSISLLEYVTDRPISAVPASPANRAREKAKPTKTKPGAAAKKKTANAPTHRDQFGPSLLSTSAVAEGAGEDLLSLAARELGDAERWRELADLNDLRDPRSVKFGQVLRLP